MTAGTGGRPPSASATPTSIRTGVSPPTGSSCRSRSRSSSRAHCTSVTRSRPSCASIACSRTGRIGSAACTAACSRSARCGASASWSSPRSSPRRWRLGLVLGLGGVLAWFGARFVGLLVSGHSFGDAFVGVFDGTRPGSYPAVHLAVIAAVILTAEPFLTRPMRRLGQFLLASLTLAALVVGPMGVNDVFAAFVLAWGIAAALHLAFGSPAGRPTVAQVAGALDELRVTAANVCLAPDQERGYTVMLADGGRRHYRDRCTAATPPTRNWWARSGASSCTRTPARRSRSPGCSRSSTKRSARSSPQQAGSASSRRSWLPASRARRPRCSSRRDRSATGWPTRPTRMRAALRELWREVRAMRGHHVAHGALDLEHVVMIEGVPTIVDFSLASVSAPQQRLDRDVANLLVSSALLVGVERGDRVRPRTGSGRTRWSRRCRCSPKPALSRANAARVASRQEVARPAPAGTISTNADIAIYKPVELRRVKPLTVVMIIGAAVRAVGHPRRGRQPERRSSTR